MNSNELKNIIENARIAKGISQRELAKLSGISRSTLNDIINGKIKNDLEKEGYYVPKNAVPMQEVVKYLNIDIDYLESRSKNLKGDVKIA